MVHINTPQRHIHEHVHYDGGKLPKDWKTTGRGAMIEPDEIRRRMPAIIRAKWRVSIAR